MRIAKFPTRDFTENGLGRYEVLFKEKEAETRTVICIIGLFWEITVII